MYYRKHATKNLHMCTIWSQNDTARTTVICRSFIMYATKQFFNDATKRIFLDMMKPTRMTFLPTEIMTPSDCFTMSILAGWSLRLDHQTTVTSTASTASFATLPIETALSSAILQLSYQGRNTFLISTVSVNSIHRWCPRSILQCSTTRSLVQLYWSSDRNLVCIFLHSTCRH